jgi:hypothetical protein
MRYLIRASRLVADHHVRADEDDGGYTDDDSRFGPYSYFAHAMAKVD